MLDKVGKAQGYASIFGKSGSIVSGLAKAWRERRRQTYSWRHPAL